MKHTAVVVFSGYNQRAVIALCRVLEMRGVAYGIVSSGPDDPLYRSRYRARVVARRKRRELDTSDLLDCLGVVRSRLNADELFIVPSTEALNRYLLGHRQLFDDRGCIVPLVDESLYRCISDKYEFTRLCRSRGIRVPDNCSASPDFPLVAKPGQYRSARSGCVLSPEIIGNAAELVEFHARHDPADYFYQQYIGGRSYYLLYYISPGGGVLSFSQRNLVQQPRGKSVIAAVASDVHSQPVARAYAELFRSLQYFGLVMVEVKYWQGEFYLIEANPRLWGPSQLFVDAGCRFFEAYLHDFGIQLDAGMPESSTEPPASRYFWYGGIKPLLDAGISPDFHDCDASAFMQALPVWLEADVYRREDTRGLYTLELQTPAVA